MNCREFERLWNERLDGARKFAQAVEEDIKRHEESCARCREISARFEVLERTIETWRRSEKLEASAGFSRTVAGRFEAEKSPRIPGVLAMLRRQKPARAVAAAAIVLTFALTIASRREPARLDLDPVATRSKPINQARAIERSLALEAISEATEATWRWASTTSGPAARTGLRAWDSARPKLDLNVSSALEFDDGPAESPPPSSRLGDRFNTRFQPFSSSARCAFGFLMAAGEPAS